MVRHTLSVNPLPYCVAKGLRILNCHRQLTAANADRLTVPPWRAVKRLKIALRRRYYAWSLFYVRLSLRSKNAFSDLLVYGLFGATCILLYELYRVCRVGVNRAEERYRTLAIPILQTFEALEASQERRRRLQKEMEQDILRNR